MSIGQSKLHEQLRKYRLLRENLAWINAFGTPTKRQILDWIKYDQLEDKGIDSRGSVIGYYSMLTARINPKKKFNTHYTLKDTGDLFRSMYVDVFMSEIRIGANDQKLLDQKWYTKQVIALTDEHFEKLKEKVKESYIQQLREILQLN